MDWLMAGANAWLRRIAPNSEVALADALAALDEARSGFGWIAQTLALHGTETAEACDHAKYHQQAVINAISSCEKLLADEETEGES